jgi:TusA-related sulfurtransferase
MKTLVRLAALAGLATALGAPLLAQTTPAPGADHHAAVNERGDHVMGFDHDKTTHHFRLTKSGGVIEVSANDPNDTASRDAIRQHLGHIVKMFSEGDFNAPMLIHGQVPPGVPEMKANLKVITWKLVNTRTGARIVITSKDPAAIKAIHQFLIFQIQDHQTGDPTTVQN